MNTTSVMNSFFVIDSNNLDKVKNNFIGYTYQNGEVILKVEDYKNFSPDLNGAWVFIKKDNKKIYIKQDFIGCWGLYLYQHNDYFALSNSFMYLVEYLSKNHKLTINEDYLNGILFTTRGDFSYNETLINEIELLDRNTEIVINTEEKTFNLNHIDFKEKSIELNSEQGIKILDNWYYKWCTLIRSLYKNNKNLIADLTGGMDSRIMFCLFLGANININDICINSKITSIKDYPIAKKIADFYHFELNQNNANNKINNCIDEIINASCYTKLSIHSILHFRSQKFQFPVFHFKGYYGECLRDYWKYKNKKDVINAYMSNMRKLLKENENLNFFMKLRNKYITKSIIKNDYPKIQTSITKTLNSTVENLEKRYKYFNKENKDFNIASALYKETRCRVHFGRVQVESFLAGNLVSLSPLGDIDLHRLKLDNIGDENTNLLVALILDRYAPNLLNFEFDGNRKIDEKTICLAKELNSKYPLKINFEELKDKREDGNERLIVSDTNKALEQDEIKKMFDRVMKSNKLKKVFLSFYSKDLYTRFLDRDGLYIKNNLRLIYNLIGVAKILDNINSKKDKTNICDFLKSC